MAMKQAFASSVCLTILFISCERQKAPQSASNSNQVVNEVIITGNRRTPTDVIKANIHTQPGAVNSATLNADIDRLRSLGVYVDDVSVSDGSRAHILHIHVKDDLPAK